MTATAPAPAADGLPPATPTANRFLAVMQRVGRSLMLPIAVMPAAGLLIRLGSPDILGERPTGAAAVGTHGLYLATLTGWHWLIYVQQVFSAAGNGIFNFIPLLFAIGVAVGFARRADGTTALAAAVVRIVGFGVQAACTSDVSLNVLQYVVPVAPTVLAWAAVFQAGPHKPSPREERRRRRRAAAAEPQWAEAGS